MLRSPVPKHVLRLRWPTFALLAIALAATKIYAAAPLERPNVVLIMTDDQGYGDLSCHGNPKLKTPHLDRLAGQSVEFKSFYVCPVCSPTHASLMTGRYNYRTGAVDTYLGRSMMYAEEVTLAEMLHRAGYRTGIFGKWHLGDNYPLRAMDQGFEECLVHRGGGIGQPADPPGNRYFDPILQHNGQPVRTHGYCSDVFTTAAIEFVERHRAEPFFVYLPYNCPHTPLQVPEKNYQHYKAMDLSPGEFPAVGHALPGKVDQDAMARVYGMVANLDENIGRLLAALDRMKLSEKTLIVFLSDNGPQQARYNAGMLDRKGNVHEGGIRVPCFIRWQGTLETKTVDRIAAHIDLAPTLLEACHVEPPEGLHLDGKSLMPLLRGAADDWPDRELFFQWHRGDVPQPHRACAVRGQRYKLVQPRGVRGKPLPAEPKFELFDMQRDPLEMRDIAAEHPAIVKRLRHAYDAWFADVSGTRGFAPPRIDLGTRHENPVVLTRQDWRGPRAGWRRDSLGFWEVRVAREADYKVILRFAAAKVPGSAVLKIAGTTSRQPIAPKATTVTFRAVHLGAGPARLEAELRHGEKKRGVEYVDVFLVH